MVMALAGILFTVPFTSSVVLSRLSIPSNPEDGRSRRALDAMAGAGRFSRYGSDAGFGSPCLMRCEKEASLSAAWARSFTRESFSKSANGFALSMRPSS
jgi:hypothetical protein